MTTDKEEKFYLKLRKNISKWLEKKSKLGHKWKEYILIVPDIFYLLVKLVQDKDVPQGKKVKLISAIAYFISPIDVLPEAILGPIGYLDDIAVAAYVLNDIINTIDPQIIRRNWVGEQDILYLVKNILANVDGMIGKGIWDKLKGKF
jgi:uncharacterized membrane protein YkvA (DUF1232 family)